MSKSESKKPGAVNSPEFVLPSGFGLVSGSKNLLDRCLVFAIRKDYSVIPRFPVSFCQRRELKSYRGGLYWRRASKEGAIVGLIAGVLVNTYFQVIVRKAPLDIHAGNWGLAGRDRVEVVEERHRKLM